MPDPDAPTTDDSFNGITRTVTLLDLQRMLDEAAKTITYEMVTAVTGDLAKDPSLTIKTSLFLEVKP